MVTVGGRFLDMFANLGWLIALIGVGAWLGLGCVAGAHAVMYKRDSRSAAIWLVISFSLPLVGPWLYWGFGINRIERRAVKRIRRRRRRVDLPDLAGHGSKADLERDAVGHLSSLRNVADRVTELPMLPGNTIKPLHNGEQAYPRMLDAISRAERTVTLASYVFDWGDVGQEFADALAAAAARGVRVHALVDGVGALGHFSRIGRRMLKSGVEVAAFFPLRFPFGRVRLNLRNHRKITVVDGNVGFTGGMNISQRHLVERPEPGRVEDLHFEITGPVVAEMQHAFAHDWALATQEALSGEAYFPPLSATGLAFCRGIAGGPDENLGRLQWILLAAFAAARHSVWIVTPYFVPTPALTSAMGLAALRGVDIKLILPSHVDHRFMRWAADAYLWQVLERGIRVFRRPPPFVHTKLLVVDDRWILLGSANLDPRSLRLNFEFNVEAYDAELARDLAGWLDGLLPSAREVRLEEMDGRPKWRRLRDGLAKLASPHL